MIPTTAKVPTPGGKVGSGALRNADGKLDREAVIRATEEKRAPLAAAIKDAFVPVEHTIEIQPAK